LASQTLSNSDLYFKLKEVLLDITENIYGTKIEIGANDCMPTYMHPVNSTNIFANETNIGYFGILHPSVKLEIDKRFNIAILEVDINSLLTAQKLNLQVKKVSKFQDVNIDYTFLVPKTMKYAQLEKHMETFKAKLIWSYKLTDIYESETLGDYVSWTIKYNICSLDKTLSSKDIDIFNMRMLQHMEQIGLKLKG